MFGVVLPDLSSETISQKAESVDAPARQNHPTGKKRSVWFTISFVRWLEGHFQTRFHLRDFIGKRLEFTRFSVMHVWHEDAEFVVRQSAQHLLDFWKMDCLLSSPQRLWQTCAACQ